MKSSASEPGLDTFAFHPLASVFVCRKFVITREVTINNKIRYVLIINFQETCPYLNVPTNTVKSILFDSVETS